MGQWVKGFDPWPIDSSKKCAYVTHLTHRLIDPLSALLAILSSHFIWEIKFLNNKVIVSLNNACIQNLSYKGLHDKS